MKKFLFTLAALLMAGTAFAANVYIPDTEFTEDQIGKQQGLPVNVQLDNEYLKCMGRLVYLSEGLEFTFMEQAADDSNGSTNQDGDEAC